MAQFDGSYYRCFQAAPATTASSTSAVRRGDNNLIKLFSSSLTVGGSKLDRLSKTI